MCLICLGETDNPVSPVDDNPHLTTCQSCADEVSKKLSEPVSKPIKDTI